MIKQMRIVTLFLVYLFILLFSNNAYSARGGCEANNWVVRENQQILYVAYNDPLCRSTQCEGPMVVERYNPRSPQDPILGSPHADPSCVQGGRCEGSNWVVRDPNNIIGPVVFNDIRCMVTRCEGQHYVVRGTDNQIVSVNRDQRCGEWGCEGAILVSRGDDRALIQVYPNAQPCLVQSCEEENLVYRVRGSLELVSAEHRPDICPPSRPIVKLWQGTNAGGEIFRTGSNSSRIPGPLYSTAASLAVTDDSWVVFYSKPDYSGSELRIKGPYYINDLGQIVKKNGPCIFGATVGPPGEWLNEIASLQIFPSTWGGADGCGTNCPGPGYCGPRR